mmetsp:Transcript_58751/g.137135  ORF Transcript_58751/g.137135 Transcript_58751/m.137135 type:complete len:209 (+) Transcript_58751:3715-4341(+)
MLAKVPSLRKLARITSATASPRRNTTSLLVLTGLCSGFLLLRRRGVVVCKLPKLAVCVQHKWAISILLLHLFHRHISSLLTRPIQSPKVVFELPSPLIVYLCFLFLAWPSFLWVSILSRLLHLSFLDPPESRPHVLCSTVKRNDLPCLQPEHFFGIDRIQPFCLPEVRHDSLQAKSKLLLWRDGSNRFMTSTHLAVRAYAKAAYWLGE